MAPYTYSGYYDPVGSQTNHPQGYTYQNSTTPASAYPSSNIANQYSSSSYQQYGNSVYESQHRSADGQTAGSNTDRAAASLSSLSGQDFGQGTSNRSGSSISRCENTPTWNNPSYTSNAYSSNTGLTQTTRSQASTSPVYGSSILPNPLAGRTSNSQLADTSRIRNAGYEPSNNSSSTYSDTNYATQTHTAQQSQRFSSPLHAQQAQQQGHKPARSTGSGRLASPQLVQQNAQQRNRQQSSSTEATNTTVNPAAVYDNRAELQRKAQLEAERRRKQQEAEAARKAEEERVKAAQQAGEERLKEQERQEAIARLAAEAAERKKEENARRAEQRKKKREEKLQSKNAASALQQLATSAYGGEEEEASPANDEEAEMRAMFKRMREFNQRNPTMLAKLWEEERRAHSVTQAQPKPKQDDDATQPAKSPPPAQSQQHQSAAGATPVERPQSQGGPQIKPFNRPPEPATAQKAPQARPQQAIWPPGQKGHLAQAAAHWLNTQPRNAGKQVSQADILKLLDENPPYVTLCESLEAKGMRFERAAFAKELLRAAPESMKTQPSLKPTTPLSTTNSTAPQVNGSSQSRKGKENARGKSVMVEYELPNFSAASNVADGVHRISGQPSLPVDSRNRRPVQEPIQSYQSPYFAQPSHRPMSQPVVHEDVRPAASIDTNGALFQPPSAEQKAQIEPSLPPNPPADKEEAARKRTFGDLVDLTGVDSDDEAPPSKLKIVDATTLQTHSGTPQPASSSHFHTVASAIPGWIGRQGPGNGSLPCSKSPAYWSRPVTMYVGPSAPQTSSGPIPVAPMQAPAPPKPKGPSQEQLQQQRVKGKMLVEPIMRDRVARKSTYDSRTIARDVLLATGRHPDMRPLNGHLATMQRLLGEHGGQIDVADAKGNRSDLATVRWDIIDPGTPVTEAKARAPDAHTKSPIATLAARPRSSSGNTGALLAEQDHGQSKAAAQYFAAKKIGRSTKHDLDKRQNRANGADRKPFGVLDTRSLNPSARPATPKTATQQRDRTTPMSSEGAVGYAAFRQIDEDGNIIKRKGRPPGWRKHIHSREAHGLAPVKPGTSFTPSSAKKPQPLAEPVYQVFDCAWQDCNAKLHNLDALKKHLVKNHGKANDYGTFDCLWSDCGEPASQDLAEWIGHVDREHLQPVAWKLGDGPKAGLAVSRREESTSSAYLFDASGRYVTPVIRPLPEKNNANQVPLPKVSHLSMSDPASEFESLRQHKRIVGPTMEKNGCTLANRKRRLGFLDDEDFEDEIEEGDGEIPL